jgi:hypothetical protein
MLTMLGAAIGHTSWWVEVWDDLARLNSICIADDRRSDEDRSAVHVVKGCLADDAVRDRLASLKFDTGARH